MMSGLLPVNRYFPAGKFKEKCRVAVVGACQCLPEVLVAVTVPGIC